MDSLSTSLVAARPATEPAPTDDSPDLVIVVFKELAGRPASCQLCIADYAGAMPVAVAT